jgi:ATP-binding cassette subfamily B protein
MAFTHPGGVRRFAQPGAIAPPDVKFSFWSSMADLGRLVMRSQAKGLRMRLVLAIGLVVVGKWAGVNAPVFLGDAVNALTEGRHEPGALGMVFLGLAGAFVGLRFVASIAPYLRDIVFTHVAQMAMARSAMETFGHSLSLSIDYHQGKQTGTLSRIIDRGARSTDFLLRSVVFNLGPTALELVMAAYVLASHYNWRFAAVAVATVLVYVAITFRITNWRIAHRRELNEADSRAAGLAVDALINYETIKTFGSETRIVGDYQQAMTGYAQAAVKANTSLQVLNGIQSVVLNLGLAAMVVLAGLQVTDGQMRVGDVVAAILVLMQIYQPLNMLGMNYREIRQAFVDMEQMLGLRAVAPDIVDAPDAQPLPPATGQGADLVFDDVSFRHDARSHGLLGVSFRAPPGSTVALVGPSGAGKTTAVRLALRLIDPQEGRVLIDGVDARHAQQASLRRAIALVPQDVALFNDSLHRNIAFARPDATAGEVREAADAAELGAFIDSLPAGLETMVGERGLKLSGGERQRVGIARALLANPRLLILDEATSALDGRTEEAIQATLRKVREGRTTLVIAHRLSTIADADEIVVLRRGRVVEQGDHETLLARGGEYAALWRRQTRET